MKLDEVARLAGVSRTTASYVINGKAKQYRISAKTVEKVMAVVKEYNFQPNVVAAGLRAGKTFSIGLVIPDLENTSYTRIANHLEQMARRCGYQLLIACSEDLPDNEMRCVEHLLQRQVDALIVSPSLVRYHPFYETKLNKNRPIIALDRSLNPQHFVSVVGSDFKDAKTLANKLASFNFRSVLYFGAMPELSVSQLREQGFRNIFDNNQYQVSYLYVNSYNRESASELFSQWLDKNELPDALFITSFSLLRGAIDCIIRRTGRLPRELIIATFGDNEMLDFLECPVLSMAQRHHAIAEQLLNLVLNKVDHKCCDNKNGLISINRVLMLRGSLNRSRGGYLI